MARKIAKSEKDEAEKILDRLSRIEGQLKGIRRMVENKNECVDIVAQILAIREAVGSLGIELLKTEFICNKRTTSKMNEDYLKALFKVR